MSSNTILKIVVRQKLIRLYDVLSTILFSMAAGILTSAFKDYQRLSVWQFICLLLCSPFFVLAGWCSYSLSDKVSFYMKGAVNVPSAAIKRIKEDGEQKSFVNYFIFAWISLVAGLMLLLIQTVV